MNKKSKAIRVCLFIVLLLALFSALMIRHLHKKSTEDALPAQYSEIFGGYLLQTLDAETRSAYEAELAERLASDQMMDDAALKSFYLDFVQRKEASGFRITEAGILCAEQDKLIMQYEIDKTPIIGYFTIARSDFGNLLYLSGVSEFDLVAGGTFRFLEKDRKIILMLEQTDESLLLQTAWVNANDGMLSVNYKGEVLSFEKSDAVKSAYTGYEDIADLTVCGGMVTQVKPYRNKTHGKLLSVKQIGSGFRIEVEGLAPMTAGSDMQVYDLCGERRTAQLSDLTVGYDFADYVLDESGGCVAALICRHDKMENIRVVLRTDNFEELYHQQVKISCDTDYQVIAGQSVTEKAAGETMEMDAAGEWSFTDRIKIVPKAYTGRVIVHSLNRSQGTPAYRGQMEIERTDSGFLLVNELPLDEYLYSVVPSEMPASYPAQALAAQSVSARSYAYSHMLHGGMQKYGAHVDDSASFQVYNNMNESEATTLACRQTAGEILYYGSEIATTYFYSTSCGWGTDMRAWTCDGSIEPGDRYLAAEKLEKTKMDAVLGRGEGDAPDTAVIDTDGEGAAAMTEEENFAAFIRSDAADCFEAADTYFRWYYETEFDEDLFWENLKKRFEASKQYVLTKTETGYEPLPIDDAGHVLAMEITRRAEGGAAIELLVTSEHKTYKIMTEKNIRYIMANENTAIKLSSGYDKDGTVSNMLPSAFLTLDALRDGEDGFVTGYKVFGGGFGHGIGMSQNGAKAMAKAGYDYRSILAFFYRDTRLENISQ